MPLLEPLRPMFDAQRHAPPVPTDADPVELRAAMHLMIEQAFTALTTPQPPVAFEHDVSIPVDQGTIILRVYRDDGGTDPLPCHLHFHGGGFFLGTLDQSDSQCRRLVRQVGCSVISVDYRLAPEHKFPVAVNDCFAALVWVAEHAALLKIDPTRISVGGGSAGGNLAAVVAQIARDRGGPDLVAQLLEIPVTDFTATQTLNFEEEGIHIAAEKGYAPIYLRDERDARNPAASPLLAQTLADLPPALVICAEYDQLQPEGAAYAHRMAREGGQATYHLLRGEFHGSSNLDKRIPEQAAHTQALIASFLGSAYGMSRKRAE